MFSGLEGRSRPSFDPAAIRREFAERDPVKAHNMRRGVDEESLLRFERRKKSSSGLKRADDEALVKPKKQKTSYDRGLKLGDMISHHDARILVDAVQTPSLKEERPEELEYLERDLNRLRAEQVQTMKIWDALKYKQQGLPQKIELPKGFNIDAVDEIELREKSDSLDNDIDLLESKVNEYKALLDKGLTPAELRSVSQRERDRLSRSVGGIVVERESKRPDQRLEKLGFSQNEIKWVLSEDTKERILKGGITRDEWIRESRLSHVSSGGAALPTKQEGVTKKKLTDWLSGDAVEATASGNTTENIPSGGGAKGVEKKKDRKEFVEIKADGYLENIARKVAMGDVLTSEEKLSYQDNKSEIERLQKQLEVEAKEILKDIRPERLIVIKKELASRIAKGKEPSTDEEYAVWYKYHDEIRALARKGVETQTSSFVEPQSEKTLRAIPQLGYSDEQVRGLSSEELTSIYKNQILPEVFFADRENRVLPPVSQGDASRVFKTVTTGPNPEGLSGMVHSEEFLDGEGAVRELGHVGEGEITRDNVDAMIKDLSDLIAMLSGLKEKDEALLGLIQRKEARLKHVRYTRVLFVRGFSDQAVREMSPREIETNFWQGTKPKPEQERSAVEEDGETVAQETYAAFVETGDVPESRLEEIAQKIKTAQPLTAQEQAMYKAKAAEIEQRLRGEPQAINQEISTEQGGAPGAFENKAQPTQTEVSRPELSSPEAFFSYLESNRTRGTINPDAVTEEHLAYYRAHRRELKDIERARKAEKKLDPATGFGVRRELSPEGVSDMPEAAAQETLRPRLEAVYENQSKESLIVKAKQLGIPSGGDKQKLVENLAQYTTEKFSPDARVAQKLSSFGLSPKELLYKNPEFFTLSVEKQLYALSKIDQKIYLQSELSSKDQVDHEIADAKPKKWFNFGGHMKQAWKVLKSGHRQVAVRESLIQQAKKGGIQEYQGDLAVLTSYLAEAPTLTYQKDERGKLVPMFEYVKTESQNKKYETPKIFFNRAASKFAEIPYEWSLAGATGRQKEAHEKAFAMYVRAREALTRALSEESPQETPEAQDAQRRKIVSQIGQVHARVNFARLITQNPDLENTSRLFFEKTLGGRIDERLKFLGAAALGYGTKWIGRSMAVTGIGVGAAAAVGGAMSVYKKNKEFSEKEFRARYGKDDTRELGMKKSIQSKKLADRLEEMLDQFERGRTSGGKRADTARTLERIGTRLFVNESLLRDGRVIFSSFSDEQKFTELTARAATTLEVYKGQETERTDEEKLFDQYKTFIGDRLAGEEKKKEIAKAALMGAVAGATGFFAGRAVGKGIQYVRESGVLGSLWQSMVEATQEIKSPTSTQGAGPSVSPVIEKAPVTSSEEVLERARKVLEKPVVEATTPQTPSPVQEAAESSNTTLSRPEVGGQNENTFNMQDTVREKISEGFAWKRTPGGDIFTKEVPMAETASAEASSSISDAGVSLENQGVTSTPVGTTGENFIPQEKPAIEMTAPKVPAEASLGAEGIRTLEYGGKQFEANFQKFSDGKLHLIRPTIFDWNLDDAPRTRDAAVQKLLKPNFLESVSRLAMFYDDFDRIVIAEQFLDSGKFPVGSEEHGALLQYLEAEKSDLVKRYGNVLRGSPTPLGSPAETVGPESSTGESVKKTLGKPTAEMNAVRGAENIRGVEVSRTPEESTYSFNSKEIDGDVRFVYKDGKVVGLQERNFKVAGQSAWRRQIIDNWRQVAKFETGIPRSEIRRDFRSLEHLRALLNRSADSFTPQERGYLSLKASELENKYLRFLKRS